MQRAVSSIKKSVEILKSSGVDHEFRTTVVKELHTEADMESIGQWLEGDSRYFLQSYKLSDDILAPDGLSPFSTEELAEILAAARACNSKTELRGV